MSLSQTHQSMSNFVSNGSSFGDRQVCHSYYWDLTYIWLKTESNLIYTVSQQNAHLFSYDCSFCWPISIVSGTQYTVLMCNISICIYPHHLLTVATLSWEINQVHNDTCQLKTLGVLLHSLKCNKFNCTTKRVQVQLLQQMFEMSSFFLHTGAKSVPPFIFSIISGTLRQSISCVSHPIRNAHICII